ncbi:hypothetical protein IEQ34_000405 [Dendrobium chrysotoxum]|uniref:Uncharacterized protein n=1 Tax=Dendrobium chrysotoxum TaxID=161865 RepID=A0AAV7HPH8_DENCH|nr:hypothetical protein IEQ34_000405 [Dendrobium chrysotoxum]
MLVGKFALRHPNLDLMFTLFGSFSVGLLDQCHIVIQSSNDLDYSSIFFIRSYKFILINYGCLNGLIILILRKNLFLLWCGFIFLICVCICLTL